MSDLVTSATEAEQVGEGTDTIPANMAVSLPSAAYRFWKRAFDILTALVALLVLSPVLILIAAAIKLTSPGPVLFLQNRYGEGGEIFRIYKFRTMYWAARDMNAQQQTVKIDRRVTRFGRFLRAHSLDELPQLLNVLFGTMSLVGPRPHATGMVIEDRPLISLDNWELRYAAKPGITGWAQINGSRGALHTIADAYERLDFDLAYINKQSLAMDFQIILRTFKVFLKDNRAY